MSSPMIPEGPPPPDVEIGTSMITFIWVMAGMSALVLGLRLFAVFHVLRRIRLADYVMVLAFIFIVVAGALVHKSYLWGLGRHAMYLSPEEGLHVRKWNYLGAGFMLVSAMLGRISFCLFLLNTVATKKVVQTLLYIAIATQIIFQIIILSLLYGGCGTHLSAGWDFTVKAKCIPFTVSIYSLYFISAWNAFTDLFLTVIPAILLKDLKICLKKKVVAMALLCLSGFAFIAALIKTVMTREMSKMDYSWSIAKLNFWVFGETYIVIIVASAPLMNSLVKWGKETLTSRGYGKSTMASGHRSTIRKSWMMEQVSTYEKSNSDGSKEGLQTSVA